MEFPEEHWEDMSQMETERLEGGTNVLDNFKLIYARIDPEHYEAGIEYQNLKNYLGTVEAGLIRSLDQRCNVRKNRPNPDNLKYGPPESAWDEFKALLSVKQAAGDPEKLL